MLPSDSLITWKKSIFHVPDSTSDPHSASCTIKSFEPTFSSAKYVGGIIYAYIRDGQANIILATCRWPKIAVSMGELGDM